MIRIPIPKYVSINKISIHLYWHSLYRATKETRDKMSKVVSQMSEQMKSKIRNIRQDGMKQLKQDAKSAPADEIKKLEKLVNRLKEWSMMPSAFAYTMNLGSNNDWQTQQGYWRAHQV